MLDGVRVGYEFTRSRRRTIGFSVDADGLSVRAPSWAALHNVDAAIREKGRWILRKLEEMRQRRDRSDATHFDWKEGVSFPFIGRPVVVQLEPAQALAGVEALFEAGADEQPAVLRLGLAHDAGAASERRPCAPARAA